MYIFFQWWRRRCSKAIHSKCPWPILTLNTLNISCWTNKSVCRVVMRKCTPIILIFRGRWFAKGKLVFLLTKNSLKCSSTTVLQSLFFFFTVENASHMRITGVLLCEFPKLQKCTTNVGRKVTGGILDLFFKWGPKGEKRFSAKSGNRNAFESVYAVTCFLCYSIVLRCVKTD